MGGTGRCGFCCHSLQCPAALGISKAQDRVISYQLNAFHFGNPAWALFSFFFFNCSVICIKFTFYKCTTQWFLASLQNYVSPLSSSGALSLPQKETPHPLLGFTPHFPFYLWSLMTPSLFSVSEFAYLDTLWKQRHTLCGLLCLAACVQHSVSKVHPHCSICQYFIPFYGLIAYLIVWLCCFECPYIN